MSLFRESNFRSNAVESDSKIEGLLEMSFTNIAFTFETNA